MTWQYWVLVIATIVVCSALFNVLSFFGQRFLDRLDQEEKEKEKAALDHFQMTFDNLNVIEWRLTKWSWNRLTYFIHLLIIFFSFLSYFFQITALCVIPMTWQYWVLVVGVLVVCSGLFNILSFFGQRFLRQHAEQEAAKEKAAMAEFQMTFDNLNVIEWDKWADDDHDDYFINCICRRHSMYLGWSQTKYSPCKKTYNCK